MMNTSPKVLAFNATFSIVNGALALIAAWAHDTSIMLTCHVASLTGLVLLAMAALQRGDTR